MTRFVSVALVAALSLATIGGAAAAQCIRAGGWGTGVMESFASFMATAAMKNQAKAWGGERVKIRKYQTESGYFEAFWEPVPVEEEATERELEVTMRSLVSLFEQYVKLNRKIPPELLTTLAGIEDPSRLADTVAAHMAIRLEEKQVLLEMGSPRRRMEHLMALVEGEIDVCFSGTSGVEGCDDMGARSTIEDATFDLDLAGGYISSGPTVVTSELFWVFAGPEFEVEGMDVQGALRLDAVDVDVSEPNTTKTAPLSRGYIVVPPSGQVKVSAPLSVEYMTMVFSSRPSSLSLASTWPTCPSCSAIPSA